MSYDTRRRDIPSDAVGSDDTMPDHSAQSPSSSVSSLSGSEVVFSQPALAASRENDVLVDLDNDDDDRSNVFSWPAVESPAAHASPMRPTHRALLLGGTTTPDATPRPQLASPPSTSALIASSERRRQAIAIALNNREAEQAQDPSTSLARRIAARQAARQSANNHEPEFPTARFLSRTTISTSEPDPPADLRRLATTREAERQLHYRDWHRLGLFDPSTSVSGSDGPAFPPARGPGLVYARRRPSASTIRPTSTVADPNAEDQDDDDILSMDMTHRLRRRMAALDALDPISDAQLDREHDSATPLPSMSTSMRASDRRMARIRPWLGLGSRSHVPTDWEDGRNDPNGENTYSDDGTLTTPAARSRYWHALSNAASEDLLTLAAERMSSTPAAPPLPPGLTDSLPSTSPTPKPTSTAAEVVRVSPLPTPLETMLLPTPRQRYVAAFRASPAP